MSETRRRIPELDGLRVLMIFIVSWYHIWQQSWLRPMIGNYSLDYLVRSGYVWVDGTVLLSAFLLFLPYAKAMISGGRIPDAGDFYFRRVKRVIPAYYFITLVTLFAIALPWNLYATPQYLVKDLATHLTFTFNFFPDTYLVTPLGAASWTLAVEVQAYLLFPLIARCAMKKPAVTLTVLCLVGFGFRAWCIWALSDYSIVLNQLLNFLDVYALGILSGMVYVRLRNSADTGETAGRKGWICQPAATALFIGIFIGLLQLLRYQARSADYVRLQERQMILRPAFALGFAGMILSAPFCLRPVRWLLGNRVTAFLAAISMNFYLIHQTLAVHMRRIGFPASASEMPNMAGEQPWQTQYTLLAFVLSLAAAVLVTYLIEKPAGKWLRRKFG
jgi:peptidoglycan/LPS O-acetylase OafA/YrhL